MHPPPSNRTLAVVAATAAAAALAAASSPAAASPRIIFGFADNLPMVAGPSATAPAAALGARGYAFTLTWSPGKKGLTADDTHGLTLAMNALAKAPRPFIRPLRRKSAHRRQRPKRTRAPAPRVILVVQTLGTRVPLDDAARTDFCTYARSALAGFPAIKDVVIGNEANTSFFWRPQFNWDGTSAAPAAYEALLARCYDMLHAFRPNVNVGAPGTSPDGNDNALAFSNVSHSPTTFIRRLADAYRASGRTARIFDTVVHHPYGLYNDERPYLMHPLPNTIGEGDWNRLVTTFKEAFAGTRQPVPGRCFRGSRCVPIWYLETGFQTTPPPGARLYYGIENVRTIPDVFSGPVPSAAGGSEAPAPDQASQIRYAVRLAYCQPYVDAVFNFLIRDDPNLVGYQSGVIWADWTRKRSFPAVQRVVRALNEHTISCRAPRAPKKPAAEVLAAPARVNLTWGPATSPIGVAGYSVFRNGALLGRTTSLGYPDTTVVAGRRYVYVVRAYDAAGKIGLRSRRLRVAVR